MSTNDIDCVQQKDVQIVTEHKRKSWCEMALGWVQCFSSPKFFVFIPYETPIVQAIKDEFRNHFNCEFVKEEDLSVIKRPLIAICLVSSRLESDLEYVLKKLQSQHEFAVVVMNLLTEDALPRSSVKSRVDLDFVDKYEHITFIDVAFTNQDLMYFCKMNTQAKQEISSYITNQSRNI